MTRKILWFTILGAACGFTSLHADLTIVEHFDGAGEKMDSTVLVKDGHIRFVYSPSQTGHGPGDAADVSSTIFDLKSGDMISVLPAQKSYIRIPLAPADRDAMMQSAGLLKDGGTSLKLTGKKDTISGYAADEYTGAVASREMTVWLTKAMPDYENIARQMSAAFSKGPAAAMLESMGTDLNPLQGGIPVRTIGVPNRTVYESESGKTVCTVLSISTKPIADSEFDVPADYQQISISPPPPR